jgi:hypothetical protein
LLYRRVGFRLGPDAAVGRPALDWPAAPQDVAATPADEAPPAAPAALAPLLPALLLLLLLPALSALLPRLLPPGMVIIGRLAMMPSRLCELLAAASSLSSSSSCSRRS